MRRACFATQSRNESRSGRRPAAQGRRAGRTAFRAKLAFAALFAVAFGRAASAADLTWTPTAAVRLSTPQVLSASLGAIIGTEAKGRSEGLLVQVEPGLHGGKFRLGWGANKRVIGTSMAFSALRTWRNPPGTDPGLTYFGAEGQIMVVGVVANLGLYQRVSGSAEPDVLLSFGIGVGF
jgi:hypothetical protein